MAKSEFQEALNNTEIALDVFCMAEGRLYDAAFVLFDLYRQKRGNGQQRRRATIICPNLERI